MVIAPPPCAAFPSAPRCMPSGAASRPANAEASRAVTRSVRPGGPIAPRIGCRCARHDVHPDTCRCAGRSVILGRAEQGKQRARYRLVDHIAELPAQRCPQPTLERRITGGTPPVARCHRHSIRARRHWCRSILPAMADTPPTGQTCGRHIGCPTGRGSGPLMAGRSCGAQAGPIPSVAAPAAGCSCWPPGATPWRRRGAIQGRCR